jgi:hypothetical protein
MKYMSQAEHQSTNRPLPGAEIQPLGYLIGIQFHQPIKLIHAKGLEFAAKLSAHVDAPRGLELQENQWTFSQPLGSTPRGVFQVVVQESQLILEAAFPSHPLEWFEHRYEFILSEFHNMFTPGLLLASSAMIRGTLPIDGDARKFLTTYVTKMEQPRLSSLKRPLHLFGIRLLMPPFQEQQPPAGRRKKPKVVRTVDWVADVKAESLVEDTQKLFLEANGQWATPKTWDDRATKSVVGQLAIVSDFLKNNLLPFLMAQPSEGDAS